MRKVSWKQQITKPCWKVATVKKMPQARVISPGDVPDVVEYNERPVGGRITVMETRFGEFGFVERIMYQLKGFSLEDMIRAKYNAEFSYIEDISPSHLT